METYFPQAEVKRVLGPGHGDMKPIGLIIHYTAGPTAFSAIEALKESGLGYHLLIDKDGTAIQLHPFNRICWHCRGHLPSTHTSTNHTCIGVAVVSWGKLESRHDGFYSWIGTKVDAKEPWDLATEPQVETLSSFLIWLIRQDLNPKYIFGHHEINPAKSDPGQIIGNMSAIRKALLAFRDAGL